MKKQEVPTVNGMIKLLGMAGFVLASGTLPLYADSPTVALEPTKKIVYPNPADIIPGPPVTTTTNPTSPAASPPPITATSNTPVITPPAAPPHRLESLSNGWYLRWGPFKDRTAALAAYPGLQSAFSEPEFSQAVWSLQQVGQEWTLLAGPIPEAALGRSLWAPQAPSGLYHP